MPATLLFITAPPPRTTKPLTSRWIVRSATAPPTGPVQHSTTTTRRSHLPVPTPQLRAALCHIAGNYTTVPTDCYSCHTANYTGTTNPNHIAAAFPTTCATCHTTTAWTGATFNHTWFPIYSGTHNQNVWVTCSACHVDPNNYVTFTCIACHQHSNQASVTSNHGGVKGYVYGPTTCYTCHKN